MPRENVGWKIAGLLTALAAVLVPIYANYQSQGAQEKKIELSQGAAIDPLHDLSPLGQRVSLSVHVDDITIDNLSISQSTFRNAGRTPIVPSDFVEPLRVSVQSPWKLVAVADWNLGNVALKWSRLDDRTFVAAPALINPGDTIGAYVYVSNADRSRSGSDESASPEPKILWNARIVNLKSFSAPVTPMERAQQANWGITVELTGWALPFTLVCAILFEAMYLRLLSTSGKLSRWNASTIGIIIGITLLSFAASECTATYIFGNLMVWLLGVNHWLNAPPIAANAFLLLYLFAQSRRQKLSRTRAH